MNSVSSLLGVVGTGGKADPNTPKTDAGADVDGAFRSSLARLVAAPAGTASPAEDAETAEHEVSPTARAQPRTDGEPEANDGLTSEAPRLAAAASVPDTDGPAGDAESATEGGHRIESVFRH